MTTGDIIRQVKFLTMPGPLSVGRNAVGSRIVRRFGGIPTVSAAHRLLESKRPARHAVRSAAVDTLALVPTPSRG